MRARASPCPVSFVVFVVPTIAGIACHARERPTFFWKRENCFRLLALSRSPWPKRATYCPPSFPTRQSTGSTCQAGATAPPFARRAASGWHRGSEAPSTSGTWRRIARRELRTIASRASSGREPWPAGRGPLQGDRVRNLLRNCCRACAVASDCSRGSALCRFDFGPGLAVHRLSSSNLLLGLAVKRAAQGACSRVGQHSSLRPVTRLRPARGHSRPAALEAEVTSAREDMCSAVFGRINNQAVSSLHIAAHRKSFFSWPWPRNQSSEVLTGEVRPSTRDLENAPQGHINRTHRGSESAGAANDRDPRAPRVSSVVPQHGAPCHETPSTAGMA